MSGTAKLIITHRLRLEPFAPSHLTEQYVSWLNDAEVTKYSRHRSAEHTLDSCESYVATFAGTPNALWAIVRQSDDRHIGNINAYVDEVNSTADLGVLVGERDAWGQGIATESWGAVMQFLFSECGLRKVTGGAIAPNIAMLKVMKQCGMQDDGVRLGQQIWEGEAVDVVHMAKFREDA